MERQDRIENRKAGNQWMSRRELEDIRQETRHENSKYTVEAMMTCFALAEHRLYGFGEKRLVRSIEYVSKLMDDVISGESSIHDYIKELEVETGCVISCEDIDS